MWSSFKFLSYGSEKVLAVLDQQEELEDTLLAELDAESDDGDFPREGKFIASDGTQTLVQPSCFPAAESS